MKLLKLTAREEALLERVRRICLVLPETEEAIKWGHPNFLVKGKIFCGFGRDAGIATVGVKTTPLRQAELVASGRFHVAAYVGRFGWISYPFPARPRWSELRALIQGSYGLVRK